MSAGIYRVCGKSLELVNFEYLHYVSTERAHFFYHGSRHVHTPNPYRQGY